LASEVPAYVVAITHTDGTADFFPRCHKGLFGYYQNLMVSTAGDHGSVSASSNKGDHHLQQLYEMREYQVRNRTDEIRRTIEFLRDELRLGFGQILVAGFDIGGATAVSMAGLVSGQDGPPSTPQIQVSGAISIDGMFSVEDRFTFPRNIFENPPQVPVAFVMSDDWASWNKPVMDNTIALMEEIKSRTDERTRMITVKQTNHYNFTEVMYWVPQIMVRALRFTGLLHRRGDPRKNYRRVTKWLIALVQQYTDGSTEIDATLRKNSF
jgi:pimeloyl-ACP methyl ester carboxylesterase